MLMLLCSALIGCELVADFDRSKIPDDRPGRDAGGERDGSTPPVDAGRDAASDDAGPDEDAGSDDDAG